MVRFTAEAEAQMCITHLTRFDLVKVLHLCSIDPSQNQIHAFINTQMLQLNSNLYYSMFIQWDLTAETKL